MADCSASDTQAPAQTHNRNNTKNGQTTKDWPAPYRLSDARPQAHRPQWAILRLAARARAPMSSSDGEEASLCRAAVVARRGGGAAVSTPEQIRRAVQARLVAHGLSAVVSESSSQSECVVACASADGGQQANGRCHLCLHDFEKGPARSLKSCGFHIECWNAVRCARRIAGDARNNMDESMLKQPEVWRPQVLPLVRREGSSRDVAARSIARTAFEVSSYKKTERIVDHLVLTKKRFKSFRARWDDQSSEGASADFGDLHEEQAGKHDADGIRMVAVPENPRLRVVTGRAETHRSAISKDLPAAASASDTGCGDSRRGDLASRNSRRSSRGRSMRPRRDEGERGRRGDRRTHGDSLEKQGSRLDRSGGDGSAQAAKRARGSERDQEVEVRSAKKPRPSETTVMPASSGKARGGGGLAAMSCGRSQSRADLAEASPERSPSAEDDDDEDDAQRSIVKNASPAASLALDSEKPKAKSEKMTPVAFIQAKGEASKVASSKLAAGAGPKGLAAKIQVARDKLTELDMLKVEGDPEVVCQRIQDAEKKLGELLQAIEQCRLDDWAKKSAEMHLATLDVDEARAAAAPILDALNFLVDQAAKATKSKKNSDRYKRLRLQSKFVGGGWDKATAKALSIAVEPGAGADMTLPTVAHINPETFDPQKVTLWHKGGEESGETTNEPSASVVDKMQELLRNSNVIARMDELDKALAANISWGGAMSKLEVGAGVSIEQVETFAECELLEQRGGDPWVAALRPFAARIGPAQWPLPGVGSLISVVGESQNDLFVLAGLAAQIVAKGLALSDIEGFLSSPSGEDWVGNHAMVVPVRKGDVLWVPYGWIALPVAVTRKNYEGPPETAFAIVQAVAHSRWAAMDGVCFAAIAAWNRGHLEKVQTKRAWAARFTYFAKLSDGVAGSCIT